MWWDKENSWAAYIIQAYIIQAYKTFKSYTDDDATLVAIVHAIWTDTSDEELHDESELRICSLQMKRTKTSISIQKTTILVLTGIIHTHTTLTTHQLI
ncbi:unnamed protein product [Calypogeia fissa]